MGGKVRRRGADRGAGNAERGGGKDVEAKPVQGGVARERWSRACRVEREAVAGEASSTRTYLDHFGAHRPRGPDHAHLLRGVGRGGAGHACGLCGEGVVEGGGVAKLEPKDQPLAAWERVRGGRRHRVPPRHIYDEHATTAIATTRSACTQRCACLVWWWDCCHLYVLDTRSNQGDACIRRRSATTRARGLSCFLPCPTSLPTPHLLQAQANAAAVGKAAAAAGGAGGAAARFIPLL
jgi:hypothetical protein